MLFELHCWPHRNITVVKYLKETFSGLTCLISRKPERKCADGKHQFLCWVKTESGGHIYDGNNSPHTLLNHLPLPICTSWLSNHAKLHESVYRSSSSRDYLLEFRLLLHSTAFQQKKPTPCMNTHPNTSAEMHKGQVPQAERKSHKNFHAIDLFCPENDILCSCGYSNVLSQEQRQK